MANYHLYYVLGVMYVLGVTWKTNCAYLKYFLVPKTHWEYFTLKVFIMFHKNTLFLLSGYFKLSSPAKPLEKWWTL